MNSRELLKSAAEELRNAGVPDPEYDSGQLLSFVTGRPHLALRLGTDFTPDGAQTETFRILLERRKKREPLQYLLGSVVFRGLEFRTTPGVLIPRPETELLAEWASERMKALRNPAILDLCCGSGCIGLSLGKELPGARVTLSDLSPEAIRLTEENRARLKLACTVLQGDLFGPVSGRRFDCIVCNPPYIPSEDCGTLQPEVLWEPKLALDGGADGLDFYRRLAAEAPAYLKPEGMLLLEIGIGEAEPVVQLLLRGGAARTETRRDDAGIRRMILAEYAPTPGHNVRIP